jgi:MoxR-like ATPase
MKILVNYPTREQLNQIVERTIHRDEIDLDTVADRAVILSVRAMCREILVAPHVQDFAVDLVLATQPEDSHAHDLAKKYIRYGSSPRGAQGLVESARVLALMRGRLHVSADDIQDLAPSVLRHRIILNFDAHADGQTTETILREIIRSVAVAAN